METGEFDVKYPKKPVSVTNKDTSDHIYQSVYISLWFYSAGFGCKNSKIKNCHFYTKNENSMTQRFSAKTIKPWKWLALTMSFNISESQKRRDITLTVLWELTHYHSRPVISRSFFQKWGEGKSKIEHLTRGCTILYNEPQLYWCSNEILVSPVYAQDKE